MRSITDAAFEPGIFCAVAESAGQLWAGRSVHAANVKDFGDGDFRDIMLGVDEAARTLPVDPKRLGITGWSYGGYMTMWAVTQTHRFSAAVVRRRARELAELLRRKPDRPMDDSLFWRHGL